MKDAIKTGILVLIIIIMGLLIFFVSGHIKKGVLLLNRNTLEVNDPTVIILKDRILGLDDIRKAYIKPDEINNDDIIKYLLLKLDSNDYKMMKVEPVKIECNISDKISFTSSKTCEIKVINNDVFNDYLFKMFNLDKKLSFNDFSYHGYSCKNDGSKYYCLVDTYKDDYVSYSVIKDAYEEKDKVVIREYYLRVDIGDNERCLKYFNQGYCMNSKEQEKIPLDDEIVKNDGVLYEHVFAKNGNSFYLVESFITNER